MSSKNAGDYDVRSFFLPRRASQEEIDAVKPDLERAIRELDQRAASSPNKRKNEVEDDDDDDDDDDGAAMIVPPMDDDDYLSDDSRDWEMTPRKMRRVTDDDGSSIDVKDNNGDDESTTALDSIIDKARDYQNQFFELAKKNNIIVHLGTGMGKTLIAVLLIKHYLELEETRPDATGTDTKAKRIVFVVPSNALAIQQCDCLRANLDCSVEMASYRQELKGLGREKADEKRRIERCRVLVTTHGAMLNLFHSYRDVFDMRDVSLLIVDECHNCVKNAPYAQIMANLYRPCPAGDRPRVLGLTASPVINYKTPKGLSKQLDDLEDHMNSRVVSVHTLGYRDPDLVAKKAEEAIVPFDDRQGLPRDYPAKEGFRLLKGRLKELNQLDDLYMNVGPAVVAPYCELLLKSIEIDLFEGETEQQFNAAVHFIRLLRRYAKQKAEMDAKWGGQSKKLVALQQLLHEQVSERPDAVGIVFVKMRVTALALNHFFSLATEKLDMAEGADERQSSGALDCEQTIMSGLTLPTALQSLGPKEDGHLTDKAGNHAHASGAPLSSAIPLSNVPSVGEVFPSRAIDGSSQFDDADSDEDETKRIVRQIFVPNDSIDEAMPMDRRQEKIAKTPLASAMDPSDSDSTSTAQVTNTDHCTRIRTGVLVGRTSDLFKKAIMRHEALDDAELELLWKEIEQQDTVTRDVLQKLRRGEINVLIATSVVEEGVDVQACSFVVSFDSIDSIKSYVQMKGRARQQSAKLFSFEGDSVDGSRLLNLAATEDYILKFLRSRTKRKLLSSPVLVMEHGSGVEDALRNGFFRTEQGTVTMLTAPSFFYRFILSQPRDTSEVFTKRSLEAYFPQFSACGNILTLPAYISDPQLRIIVLPSDLQNRSPKEKERLLALAACIRLYKMKLISERFLPLDEEDVIPWLDGIVNRPDAIEPPSLETFALVECTLDVYRLDQQCETMAAFQSVLSGESVDFVVISSASFSIGEVPTIKQSHPELGHATIRLESLGRRTFTKPQLETISSFFTALVAAIWRRPTNETVNWCCTTADRSIIQVPYLVACVSRLDGEPLWNLMNRTCRDDDRRKEGRMQAARQQECGVDGLLEPRAWSPVYDPFNSYVVYGDSGLVCNEPYSCDPMHKATYHEYLMNEEYTDVNPESPLFVAQRMWQLPFKSSSALNSHSQQIDNTVLSRYRLCKGLECVLLPRDACAESPIATPSLLLASTFLPRFLYEFEKFLFSTLCLEHCSVSFATASSLLRSIPVTNVLALLSSKNCQKFSDERFDWLGSGVLKLILTDYLTTSVNLDAFARNAHAGILHMIRRLLGLNKRLEAHCVRMGLDTLIFTSPFRCDSWSPLPVSFPPSTERSAREQEEEIAACSDFIKALLGMAYSKRGYEFAFEISNELGLSSPIAGSALEQQDDTDTLPLPERTLELAKELTSYSFGQCHAVLREALTHPTKRNARTRCYQRLAWIGDAVLTVAVRDWICETFRTEPVKVKDQIETSMVCNETLAFLSLRNGIYKHIDHSHAVLPGQISAYERSISEDSRGLWGTEPPKALADVVEALVGAAHVHGGFLHGKTAALTALAPVLDLFHSAYASGGDSWTRLLHHPKRILKELAGKAVTFSVSAETTFARSHPLRRVWTLQTRSHQGESYRLVASTAHSAGRRSVASLRCRFRGNTSQLLSVADESPSPAVNRACDLALSVLDQNDDLRHLIKRFANSFRSRKAVEDVEDEGHFDWDDCSPT